MNLAIRNVRFNTNPVDRVLTYSDNIAMHTEEPLVLHQFYEKYGFKHWVEHIYSSPLIYRENMPKYSCGVEFCKVRDLISTTLNEATYTRQANEISSSNTEDELNQIIIRQYTEASNLYLDSNVMLRKCHQEAISGDVNLVPWILQLNVALRRESEFNGIAYRGADLNSYDLSQYKLKKLFVWAPFVSASENESTCFGGNTIFRIKPDGAYAMHDKRNGRVIYHLSEFPEEKEIIFPLACAYRVENIEIVKDITYIDLHTIDWN